MPMVRREFERIFGSSARGSGPLRTRPAQCGGAWIGSARSARVAGLRIPELGDQCRGRDAERSSVPRALLALCPGVPTPHGWLETMYTAQAPLPAGAHACRLVFRRVAPGQGTAWEEVVLPTGATALNLDLSLLGDIDLSAVIDDKLHPLYPDRPAAPWKDGQAVHPGWVPKPPVTPDDIPWSDPVKTGQVESAKRVRADACSWTCPSGLPSKRPYRNLCGYGRGRNVRSSWPLLRWAR